MGILKGLFGNNNVVEKKQAKVIPWVALNSLEQLDEISKKSSGKTQFIFKHSTSCGISRMVMNIFKETFDLEKEQADFYYLDLLSYRSVSNEVGIKFQVIHQSPQLLVIKNGVVVASASHGAISDLVLEDYI